MSLLILVISPQEINLSKYESSFTGGNNLKNKFWQSTYSLFILNHLSILMFNLAITCYLTVVMFFISLALQQIKYL
jgi:hypothetical protein